MKFTLFVFNIFFTILGTTVDSSNLALIWGTIPLNTDSFTLNGKLEKKSFAHMQDATGESFVDDFSHFEASLWAKGDGHIMCGHGADGPCVYGTQFNTRFIQLKAEADEPRKTELQLVMQPGCRRFGLSQDECCEDEKCVEYTGGQITSKNSYSYGSFYFVAEPAENKLNSHAGGHDAWSCFSLIRNPYDSDSATQMEISICIPSHFNPHISILWSYGDVVHHRVVRVGFNPSKQPIEYSIHWHPKRIRFFADAKVLTTIKPSSEWTIPDAPLHIKAYVMPQETEDEISDTEQNSDVEFRMYLSRIAYRKWHPLTENSKDELLTLDTHSSRTWIALFIIVFVLFIVCLFFHTVCARAQPDEKDNDGYVILIDEGESNVYGGTHAPLD